MIYSITMKRIIDEARREFIAKMIADLGKAIFIVGLASYFFEKFPTPLKLVLFIICMISLVGSVFIQPRKEQGD